MVWGYAVRQDERLDNRVARRLPTAVGLAAVALLLSSCTEPGPALGPLPPAPSIRAEGGLTDTRQDAVDAAAAQGVKTPAHGDLPALAHAPA